MTAMDRQRRRALAYREPVVPDPGPEIEPPAAARYLWFAFSTPGGDVLTGPCESLDAACMAARDALRVRGALPRHVRILRRRRGHDGGAVFRPDGSRDPGTCPVRTRPF